MASSIASISARAIGPLAIEGSSLLPFYCGGSNTSSLKRACAPPSAKRRRHFSSQPDLIQPSNNTSSCHILLTSLPTNTCPNDVFRLLRQRTSVENTTNRLKDLASLHFIRTPSLHQSDEAIATFHIDASARRFQRAVDGVSLTGKHVRARIISPADATHRLRTSSSHSLYAQLIHLLISQDAGSNVLLRGLPPSLHVSRLHDQLQSAYSLAPLTNIRHSKKTAHLRSLFDTGGLVVTAARKLLIQRKDELHKLIARKRNIGLSGILEEIDAGKYASSRALGPVSTTDIDDAELDFVGEDGTLHEPSAFAIQSNSSLSSQFKGIKGIEGPNLRLDSHAEDEGNPYSYTSPAKAFWDMIWIRAQIGNPFYPRPTSSLTTRTEDSSSSSQQQQLHSGFIPYLPIIKLPFPNTNTNRAWFVVRMTDAADAHRLVRRWHNTYYAEAEHGQRHLIEAQMLY